MNSDTHMPRCAGIIPAGGGSRRMGVNKLLLPWGDQCLLTHAIQILQQRLTEIHVVGDAAIRQIAETSGAIYREDMVCSGPLAAILTGLESITASTALVMAADLPFIEPADIDALWNLADGADVTIIRTDDGHHPLFGIYHRRCIPAMKAWVQTGARRVACFWNDVSTRIVDVGDNASWKRRLVNINSPSDYRAALARRLDAG